MAKLCVYTCITGDYDNLNEIKNPEKKVDYYCFTNNKKLTSKTWKIVQIENGELDNIRLARKIKTVGHPVVNNYDIAIWSDANIIWDKKASDFASTFLKDNPLSVFKHSIRDNVHDESLACFRLHKDTKEIIQKTMDFLEKEKYPDNNGLLESTVYIKRPKDPKVIDTMLIWFDTIKKYSRRDQLSFNYAAWKTGVGYDYINLNVWDNTWFSFVKHINKRENKNCYIYYGDASKDFDYKYYYDYEYLKKDDTYHFKTTIPIDTDQIEINPTNIIGTIYQNLSIKPSPTKIEILGDLEDGSKTIFCTGHNIIKAYGTFKKGRTLNFSIELQDIDRNTFDKLLEKAWLTNNYLDGIKAENKVLRTQNNQLQNDLQQLLNSKGWKTLEKLRKIAHLGKRQK